MLLEKIMDIEPDKLKKEPDGVADLVKIKVKPDCFIAAGNFSRGLFLCKNAGVVISSYVLLPDGSTCYANDIFIGKKTKLFGYKDGKEIECFVTETSISKLKGILYEYIESLEHYVKENKLEEIIAISYKYGGPIEPGKNYNYFSIFPRGINYNLVCSDKTKVIPKLVKFGLEQGTHFGKRVDITCLEK